MVRRLAFLTFLTLIVIFSFPSFADKPKPVGSVTCRLPEKAITLMGESYGSISARVLNAKTVERVKLEFTERGTGKDQKIEAVTLHAAKKYNPRNQAYKNSNRFFLHDEACRLNWLLPKNLDKRVNQFDAYLQQICFKKEGGKNVKLDLSTLSLKCSLIPQFKLDPLDNSPMVKNLNEIAENAEVANGDSGVYEFNVKQWNETRAFRELHASFSDREGCVYADIKPNNLNDALKVIESEISEEQTAKALSKLNDDQKLHAVLARVLKKDRGGEASCPVYSFRVYTKDGYLLELNYDLSD